MKLEDIDAIGLFVHVLCGNILFVIIGELVLPVSLPTPLLAFLGSSLGGFVYCIICAGL